MRDILLYSDTAMNVKTVTFLLRIAIQISIVLETLDLVLDSAANRSIGSTTGFHNHVEGPY